jgi:hypothetical protein
MDTKDYRIIMTIATTLAKPCICNGKTVYEVDLERFINAVDNIYPDICIPVARNGVVLNPKADENTEEEE